MGKTILLGNRKGDSRKSSGDRAHPAVSGRTAEEVTDLSGNGRQIYHSNFDENVHRHVQVAEMVLERAKRLRN